MKQPSRKFIWLIAAAYAAVMLLLLLNRESGISEPPYSPQLRKHFNPIPFHTITLFLRSLMPPYRPWLIRGAITNLLGNILLFIPLGLLPPLLWSWAGKLWKTLLLAAGIMTAIELLQMFLLVGTCDVDDLILNVTGAAIGYGIYKLCPRSKS